MTDETCLIDAFYTPNEISIHSKGRVVWAASKCCSAAIHWQGTHLWKCATCGKQTTAPGNSSSEFNVNSSQITAGTGKLDYVRDWVAAWTGFDPELIEVSIDE